MCNIFKMLPPTPLLLHMQLQAAITARGLQRMTVLMFAAESSSPEAVKAVLQSLEFMLQVRSFVVFLFTVVIVAVVFLDLTLCEAKNVN